MSLALHAQEHIKLPVSTSSVHNATHSENASRKKRIGDFFFFFFFNISGTQNGHILPFLRSVSLRKRKRKVMSSIKTKLPVVLILHLKWFDNSSWKMKKHKILSCKP